MRLRPVTRLFALTPLLLLLPVGCGSSSEIERAHISGTVTYNGEPISDGAISFTPVGDAAGPPTSAKIENGTYQTAAEYGIAPGTYQMKITAYRPRKEPIKEMSPGGLDPPPGSMDAIKEQYLPAKFNTKSTIEQVVVQSGQGSIEKNFDLRD